jgi:hypothetical protein
MLGCPTQANKKKKILLLRSLQLLVAEGQGLQDPVLVPGVPAPALPL